MNMISACQRNHKYQTDDRRLGAKAFVRVTVRSFVRSSLLFFSYEFHHATRFETYLSRLLERISFPFSFEFKCKSDVLSEGKFNGIEVSDRFLDGEPRGDARRCRVRAEARVRIDDSRGRVRRSREKSFEGALFATRSDSRFRALISREGSC